MYYLLHYDPPFWDILEQGDDPVVLDDKIMDYEELDGGEFLVVDEKGLESINVRYPQVRDSV